MLAGDDFEDQSDPVWLKDKADSLMTGGDYQGAYHAYTAALVLAANARCFANRAVAALYLGLLEQCLEDCNSSVRILDLRCRAPPGQMPTPADPLDQKVRVRVEVRMGTAYLWLGAFGKAEAHFQKALDADDGLDLEERKLVKADLERICQAKAALGPKERADAAARRCVGSNENEATETALSLYEEAAAAADDESAVVHANRCFARLKAGQLRECLEDADAALGLLRRWPTAQRAPKAPARPTRLDPPYLDDPTFKHPDQAKQNEVDWLMKHNGGSTKDLPGLPPEYEWVKDAAEKGDTAWIAVRRKMPKIVIDAIRQTTGHLQDAMYTRQPILIRQQVVVAIDQNKGGEGPSYKAIKQAEEYATKLEEHDKEREADREKEEADARQEAAEFDLEENLAPRRVGLGQAGFGHGHPLSRTRRRLFVKVLLRRARACELLGQLEESAANLRSVLKVEPESPEAKQRLAVFSALSQSSPSAGSSPTIGAEVRIEAPNSELPVLGPSGPPSDTAAQVSADAGAGGDSEGKKKDRASHGQDELDDDDAEVQGVDHASTTALLASAAEYMRKNDYPSALQIYHYARNTCKSWESPLVELKVLSNTSLCLQRIRGRLPDLISACNDTLDRIADLRYDGDARVSEEMLLRMECAALSRRGSAYAQQGKTEQSTEDAARVKELLARVAEIEATNSTGGNTAK
ncbi:unnamed protein product [Polarella glacialis]|uniref:Uncharacterized protein n=1 Tax=Polarella glacialis TaxID=89957 RepID=A0A813KFQ2_POLGL|nr:unnamed protein product [Polarella glacialis]